MSIHHKGSEQNIKAHGTYSCPVIHANTLNLYHISETI